MERQDIRFREEQRFTQKWVWGLVVGSSLLGMSVFVWGLIQQLVLGEPWGDRPMSDAALIATSAVMAVFLAAMLWLVRSARLVTELRAEGLAARFHPFHRKDRLFALSDIASAESVTYRPIRDYGGWGIRWGRAGRAYNVRGDRGVQLVLRNGKRWLIGSQRADDLAAALQAAGVTGGESAIEVGQEP